MSLDLDVAMQMGDFRYAVSLTAGKEILVLFGPSGAGKSMTLQIAAGLVRPDAGRVAIEGRTVFDAGSRINLAPQERGVGYVVQNLALFPHMTVESNVMFGMKGPAEQKRQRARELLAQFDMAGFEHRMPRTLSGGQAQRVALARALGRDARLLLLDEPFSALDDALRSELRNELLRLKNEHGLTILFVTHDLREAHLLADRIAVFDRGRVLQSGSRAEVFKKPASSRVAKLTGVSNILTGTVKRAGPADILVEALGKAVRCASWTGELAEYAPGDNVDIAIRAERVILRRGVAEGDENIFEAKVTGDLAFGSNHVLHLVAQPSAHCIELEIASRPYEILEVNSRADWLIELPPPDLHVMQPTP